MKLIYLLPVVIGVVAVLIAAGCCGRAGET